jgi:hypothetical protein
VRRLDVRLTYVAQRRPVRPGTVTIAPHPAVVIAVYVALLGASSLLLAVHLWALGLPLLALTFAAMWVLNCQAHPLPPKPPDSGPTA